MRTRFTRLTLLSVLLASNLAPTVAVAFLPDPQCAVVLDTGRIVPFPLPDGNSVIVWPSVYEGGMVTVDWLDDDGRMTGVLQHCPSDRTLSWSVPLDVSGPVITAIDDMMVSERVYSFADVAQALQGLGARARIANSGPGRCGCETFGW